MKLNKILIIIIYKKHILILGSTIYVVMLQSQICGTTAENRPISLIHKWKWFILYKYSISLQNESIKQVLFFFLFSKRKTKTENKFDRFVFTFFALFWYHSMHALTRSHKYSTVIDSYEESLWLWTADRNGLRILTCWTPEYGVVQY